uniref:SHSP domain-containing protein n=1 Tax=Glycine max TaxID=3847 RepID=K7MHL6_SOYBN
MAGVKKEDLKVQWRHRLERQCGSFLRRFRLPEDANPEKIGYTPENGVLTVTVPKPEMKPSCWSIRMR